MKWVLLFFISLNVYAKKDPHLLYKKVFPKFTKILEHKVKDRISENPVNTKILEFKNKKNKTIGYARELVTSTGCNSACLPIIATLFYSQDKKFLTIKSREGLTKKNHAPFTEQDYQSLEMILLQNPPIFNQVAHPKQMVDAITGATTKEYSPHVVKEAAYSSLRLNLYNQDTLKLLKEIK